MVLLSAATSVSPDLASAQQPTTLDELEREVQSLRGEVRALRLVLSQLAELDRQRAAVILRALESTSAPASPAPARPAGRGAPPVAVAPIAPPVLPAPSPMAAAPEPPEAQPAPKRESASAVGTIQGRVTMPSGEPVAYVYVENLRAAPVSGTVTMEQLRKQFAPRWAVIQRGTTITFPNLDNVYHNVFSRSEGNSFDLGLYGGSDGAKSHMFVTAGAVDIYCNIHPQMSARVLVVPNQYFAKVKPDGTFVIPNVPTGKRKLVAWAPGSEPTSTWVDLAASGGGEQSLTLQPRSEGHMNKFGRPYGSYQ
jgi:plastocyanin